MSDPVVNNYGPATWTDFQHNWRKADGDFLQTRSILRYQTTAARDAISSPQPGMTIYNAQTDRLEVRVAGGGTPAWAGLYSIDGLIIEPVPTNTVRLRHKDNVGSNGMVFTPTLISTSVPFITAGGEVAFDATGLTVSTGTKDAKLTTDADSLNSDTLFQAPGLISTSTLNVASTSIFTGAVTASSTLTVNGAIYANAQLSITPAPTAATHAATKGYVDTADALRLPLSGGTMSNYILIHQDNSAAGGLCLRLRDVSNKPYIDWMDWAGNQLGWIQGTTAALTVWSKGDITLNSAGGQVRTVDAVYAAGGFRGFLHGPCLTLIGTGANVYTQYYGSGSSIDSAGSRSGWMGFSGNGHMQIRNECSGGYLYMYSTYGGLIFVANNAERARFDTSGHFLIGMSAANQYSDVGLDVAIDGEIYSIIAAGRNLNCNHISGADANGAHFIRFSRSTSGAGIGAIYQVGTSGTGYATSSDYRRKTVVSPIVNAVKRVQMLRPWRAIFNDDPDRGEVDVFIAHEAAEVLPDAVAGEKDAIDDEGNPVYQDFDYSRPTPLLAAAIQELADRVTALEAAA